MAKYEFTRDFREHKKGQIVEAMQFDVNSVMIREKYATGYVCRFAPIALGSQRLLVRVK